ncbi:MAG: HAD-IIB family hydrolase [Endozoicomonas sp.]
MSKVRYLVFTDLDGSLLDHDSYSWSLAHEALQLLEQRQVAVIFNTSKTVAEVRGLQKAMGIRQPFITENGQVTTIPGEQQQLHGLSYEAIRQILNEMRKQHRFQFTGFGDCPAEQIVELTGLPLAEARLAALRQASEPLVWQDSEEALQAFRQLLEKQGLLLHRGGRFFHVCGDSDKGRATAHLVEQYKRKFPGTKWITIGLGDGMNDLPMLEAVDLPVLIRSDHGAAPDISHLPDVLKTSEPGPAGWNQAILQLLKNDE